MACPPGHDEGGLRQHWERWHQEHPNDMEWHVTYASVSPFLAPYIDYALSECSENDSRIVDVGCGTSNWGCALLADRPGASLTLVDAAVPLVEALRERHASDPRIECVAGDCRRLEDAGLHDGTASVVLDKGTLDALNAPEDKLAMFSEVVRLLRRPRGLFVSISFATAARVLLLRRKAAENGLELRMRIVPSEKEWRLVALLAFSFGSVPNVDDACTEAQLDRLLYSGALRGEPSVCFEHPALPSLVVVEQERQEDRAGVEEDATGCLVWPAAHSLSAHLCANPDLVQGRKVIELGAGTGLVGLVAAALGARESILTDLPSALPLLRRNCNMNSATSQGTRVEELVWGGETDAALREADVVIGCEIVYQHDDETYASLVKTISQILSKQGVCLIAYEFRDGMVADMSFFDGMNDVFDVEVVSLAQYGYGIPRGEDDGSRLLYVYRHL